MALVLGEEVTEADVLRLGLDGYLKLSVRFVNCACAQRYREFTPEEIDEIHARFKRQMAESQAAIAAGLPRPTWEKRVLSTEELERQRIVSLRDDVVFDLPMMGAERLDVEHLYQQLTGGPEVTLINLAGAIVDSEDGTRFVLQERLPKKVPTADGPFRTDHSYVPAGALPKDSVLVVRTVALRELEARVLADLAEGSTSADSMNKPLQSRERATLLTMIAALARATGIDIAKPSKAGVVIEALTTEIGATVSARTVEDHLKRIPEALDRRRTMAS